MLSYQIHSSTFIGPVICVVLVVFLLILLAGASVLSYATLGMLLSRYCLVVIRKFLWSDIVVWHLINCWPALIIHHTLSLTYRTRDVFLAFLLVENFSVQLHNLLRCPLVA